MSNFTFNCPHCDNPLEAQEEWRGQQANCPSCNSPIIIPDAVKTTQQQLKLREQENTECSQYRSADTSITTAAAPQSQEQAIPKKFHWKKLFIWSGVGCLSVILILFLSVFIPAISKAKQNAAQAKVNNSSTSSDSSSNQPTGLEIMGISIDGNVFHVSEQFQQKGLRFVKHKEQGDLPGVFLEGGFWRFECVEFSLYYNPQSKNTKAIRIDVPALPYNSTSENLLVNLKNTLAQKYGAPLASNNEKIIFSWILPYGEIEFSIERTAVFEEKIWVQIIYYSKDETILRNELREQIKSANKSINSDL